MFSKIINFLTLGYLARILGPEHLGIYNAIQNSGNYVNMMSSLGTQVVVQRAGAKIKEFGIARVNQIFSNAVTIYLGLNVLFAVVLGLFPSSFLKILLNSTGTIDYVLFISLIIILNAISQLPIFLILGLGEFKRYSIINIINSIFILSFSVLFVFLFESNLRAALLAFALAMVLNAGLVANLYFKLARVHGIRMRFSINKPALKYIFQEGFFYYIGNTLLGAISGLVMISLFYKHLSPVDYGFTRIGSAFGAILTIIPTAIQPVTISFLSADQSNQYLKSVQTRIIPFLSMVLVSIVAFNMDLILGIIFGIEYLNARYIVFGMILLQIPTIYLGLINNFQVARGHMNFVGFVAIIGCALLIGSSFLLIPKYGVGGYIGALCISTFVSLILILRREYMFSFSIKNRQISAIILIILLGSVSALMVYISPGYLGIPFSLLFSILVIWIFWLACLIPEEKERIKVVLARVIFTANERFIK
jgi:O-antigen/teichoic acid export membrane protein